MKNDILSNYKSKVINFIKKFYIKNDLSRNYILFGFLIIFVISALFAYSSTLKKKRLEAVDSFISSNETILLKNYLLNKLKSPYFEYDYIVKNNDSLESILKKFSVKKNSELRRNSGKISSKVSKIRQTLVNIRKKLAIFDKIPAKFDRF